MIHFCEKEEHTVNSKNKQEIPLAIVTGAARRVGAAIASRLHQAGFKVLIHCHHSIDAANALVNALNQIRPKTAAMLSIDLLDPLAAEQLIHAAHQLGGRIDLLVNNASRFAQNSLDRFDKALWDNLFASNVEAPMRLSQQAFPHLAAVSGSIVNITDIHASKPLRGYGMYCQTKAALLMQTQSLAREFAPHVRVNAVAPGAVAWPEADNALNDAQKQKIVSRIPLQCHGDSHWIAEAVLALAENKYITGQNLAVDGGRSMV